MAFNRRDEEKLAKSLVVLAVGNVLTLPAYFYSFSAGFLASCLSNVLMLLGFHSIGHERRGIQNLGNRLNNFFDFVPNQNLRNRFYNIIEGGASIYDEGRISLGFRR